MEHSYALTQQAQNEEMLHGLKQEFYTVLNGKVMPAVDALEWAVKLEVSEVCRICKEEDAAGGVLPWKEKGLDRMKTEEGKKLFARVDLAAALVAVTEAAALLRKIEVAADVEFFDYVFDLDAELALEAKRFGEASDKLQEYVQMRCDTLTLKPVPQNSFGALWFMMHWYDPCGLGDIWPKQRCCMIASMVGPLLVFTAATQLTLIYMVDSRIIQRDIEVETKLEWWISAPCLFLFIATMINAAQNGWFVTACLFSSKFAVKDCHGRWALIYNKSPSRVFCLISATLPEFLLWGYLMKVGICFLTAAQTAEEIFMNSLALVFIADVDNLMFNFLPDMVTSSWEDVLCEYFWEGCLKCLKMGAVGLDKSVMNNKLGFHEDMNRMELALIPGFLRGFALVPAMACAAVWLAHV